MPLGIKSCAFLRVEETNAQKLEVQICVFLNIKFMKIVELGLKWVHMARCELTPILDGALWLTIISKTPLTPRKAMEGPKQTNKRLKKNA